MTANNYILDSSAAVKLIVDEPESPAFRSWMLAALAGDAKFHSPSLVWYEVAHALKRGAIKGPGTASARLHESLLAALSEVEIHAGPPSARIFDVPRLTGQDSAFVALALELKARLVTYDALQAQVAKFLGIKVEAMA